MTDDELFAFYDKVFTRIGGLVNKTVIFGRETDSEMKYFITFKSENCLSIITKASTPSELVAKVCKEVEKGYFICLKN